MRKAIILTALVLAVPMVWAAEEGSNTSPRPDRWYAFHSFWPETETVKEFGEMGVKVQCFFPANTLCSLGVPYSKYPPVWLGPGRYDWDSLDRQVAQIRDANPGVKLVCMIDLNTPDWWVRLRGRQSGCVDSFYELGRILATDRWRKDTTAYLNAFLKHMESKYADAVAGYVLACGCTTEWQDCSWGEGSASRRAAWRRWMQDQGKPDPVDIPVASVRERAAHGLFRDPVEDALAIDYWKFCAWLDADTIEYFAKATHAVTGHRVPVGVYYGYIMEHSQGRLLYEGHLAYDQLFRSEALDFFLSPGSYTDRKVGGGTGHMQCMASIRYHGKGHVEEIDHRTPTARSELAEGIVVPGHTSGFPDMKSTIAGLRREFCLTLTAGTSLWWFDMFGDWYKGEGAMDAIAQMTQIWKRVARPDDAPAAEVALIVDAESQYYMNGRDPIQGKLLNLQRTGLARMGAPYDIISFADIGEMDLSKYKMVLLPNLFIVDDARKETLKKAVFRDSKTVVWVHTPGVITNSKYDLANVEALTGIPAGGKELTTHAMDGWTSVLSPTPNIPAATLRTLAAKAGVHQYIDTEEPVYATDRLLAVHSLKGGKRTIHLPKPFTRVTELFSGRVVAENASTFTDTLEAPDTVLYELTP